MTGLTDELLRRRLAERAAGARAASLATIARTVAAGPRPRFNRPAGRWAVFGSFAASIVVAGALVAGLLSRTSPAVGPSASAGIVATGSSTATQPGSSASAPVSARPLVDDVAAWTAIDWRRLSTSEFPLSDSPRVSDAVAFGDGFVAVGSNGSAGRIWRSLDGVTWSTVDGDWLKGLELQRIVMVGDRLVTFGQREGSAGGVAHGLETWSSRDGLDWEQGPAAPIASGGSGASASTPQIVGGPLGVLARGDGFTFLLGADLAAWSDVTPTWPTDVRPGPLAAGDRVWIQPGATGIAEQGVSTGAIWTSTDGRTWSKATVDGPAGVVLNAYRVDGGYVAIGSPANVGCEACFGAIVMARIAWFSVDGSHWTRVAGFDDRIFGASFVGDGHRLIASRLGLVVVIGGSTPTIADLSETIDGRTWTAIDSEGVLPTQMNEGLTVGRHGVIELPAGVIDVAGGAPGEWWGHAIEAPPTTGPTTSPAPSGATGVLPITGCDELGFSAIRCRAVVTRAEELMSPPVTDAEVLTATVMAPTPDGLKAGSVDVADVRLDLVDKSSANIPIACGLAFGGASSDRACSDDPQIRVAGGVSRDIPCGPTPGDDTHPCGPLPPDPAPATIAASRPLTLPTFIAPIDHRGHYEILVGTSTIPNGAISEISADVGDPRPAGFWIDPYIQIEVRPDRGGPPIDSYYDRRVKGQLPVHVYLVFDVTDLMDPGSILEIRNLILR